MKLHLLLAFAFLLKHPSLFAGKNQSTMQEMAAIMGEILPIVLDDKPSDQKQFYQYIQRLKTAVHDLTDDRTILAQDPSAPYIAKKLSFELGLIDAKLLQSESLIARNVVLKTLSYCISCHLQTPKASSDFKSKLAINTRGWDIRAQARFSAATRDFSNAIMQYEKALNNQSTKLQQPDLWFKDLQCLITIIIRHKKSASLTKEMASLFIDKNSSPELLHILRYWREASDRWSKDRSYPKAKSAKFQKAIDLANQGYDANKKVPNGGFVYLVRGFQLIQEVMREPPPDRFLTMAFLEGGRMAESLGDSLMFPLHEVYYEACIRNAPKSPEARQCHKHLERSRLAQLKNQKKVPDLLKVPLENLRELTK